MYVVVGLGNPGRRYATTRHNVGFMIIEQLARRWQIALAPADSACIGRGAYRDTQVTLMQPQRFMNLSGDAVVATVPELERSADGIETDAANPMQLVVIHDDLDLPCGRLRVKRGGGSGGHRGVESIAARCGTEFFRIRVGIGRPAPGHDAAAHVLEPFAPDEEKLIAEAIVRAGDAVEMLISDGVTATMNRFNQRGATPARAN